MTTSSAPANQIGANGSAPWHARALPDMWVWLQDVKEPRGEGEEPHDISKGLAMLAEAARRYGYDRWVTTSPGEGHSQVPVVPANAQENFSEPVTAARIDSSLTVYCWSLIERGWDGTSPIWFAKHVESAAPALSFEWGIHPNLVAMQLPDFLVQHFVAIAREAQVIWTNKEYSHGFKAANPVEEGFRLALEATGRAMTDVGIAKETVLKVTANALESLRSMPQDGDSAAPAAEAPSA